MPTYDYLCQSCGHRFERRQSFSDAPIEVCPECEGSVRRVIHPAGIVFKGSGFYKTDYASKGGGASEPSTSTESASTSETSASSAEPAASPAASTD